MVSIYRGPAMNCESRRGIDENTMKSLNDDRVRVVAICGAGGVGKTTMVQRIEERARNDKLFDKVVTVVVCHETVMLKIQKEIAESLGLPLNWDTLFGRAVDLFGFGSGMLGGIGNNDDGRNITHHLVDRIKSRFLLINGKGEQM